RDILLYEDVGLKNAGATYQRLVDSAFQAKLGRNLKAYIDDMVIKSKTEQDMIIDIAETFDNLRKINMKLNPMKCSFDMGEGKFLGYIVTSEGIRVNPKKTKAIADMQSLKTLKEMQSLSGKLAALNWWTDEAELAFQELKRLIMELTTLNTLEQKEALFIYLTASREAVSGVLVANRKGKQLPIWYISRTLHEAKRNYAPLEKLALCLLYLSRRLRRYFEAHLIQVITDQPIKQILNKPHVPNNYQGSGLVLIDPSGMEYTYAIRLTFSSTNNEAEYETLLAGLRIARKIKVQLLDVKVDSKLVACQMNREFVASSKGMAKYFPKAKEQASSFKKFSIKNIPSNQNQKADVLSKLASVAFNHLMKEILVEVLNAKSIDVEEGSTIVEEEGHNWMTLIIECLEKGIWPNDENEARAL
ncbi:reverse transcriptase domain-containing protein, partial [Tanacetum coccineum]